MRNGSPKDLKIAFFGTPSVAVYVLEELEHAGIVPDLIVTAPDKPAGRNLVLTPPPAKVWADEHSLSTFQPATLKNAEAVQAIKDEGPWDIFLVAAYGTMIPKEVLGIPAHGTLNMHPSLLPRLRGASPIQSAILEESETGVSIMLVDEQMDHGPIVAQEKVAVADWPPKASALEELLARRGGQMLAKLIPDWVAGKIIPKDQDHSRATFTKKITKEDGLININGDPKQNYRKIQAYDIWPRTYFFANRNGKQTRVIITDAELKEGALVIKKVIPEGKKEMPYEVFVQ